MFEREPQPGAQTLNFRPGAGAAFFLFPQCVSLDGSNVSKHQLEKNGAIKMTQTAHGKTASAITI